MDYREWVMEGAAAMSEQGWIECGLRFGSECDECLDTFIGKGLNRPGVLIQTNEPEGGLYLLGDINCDGGSCNCCDLVRGETIVVKYRVIWEAPR